MSSFLQICVDTARECRIASAPGGVTGNTGVLDDVVNWVKNSWKEIQMRHSDWRWMRRRFTFNTVAGTDSYAYGSVTDAISSAAITRFGGWWLQKNGFSNCTIYLTSAGVGGEGYLIFLEWDDFRRIYRKGTQNNSQPFHISIDPQNNLVLGPKPDGIYTIQGEYQHSPQVLAADADIPEMPTQFHDLIMYRAMEKYGISNGATEVFNRGQLEGNRIMHALELNQLEPTGWGPPLA